MHKEHFRIFTVSKKISLKSYTIRRNFLTIIFQTSADIHFCYLKLEIYVTTQLLVTLEIGPYFFMKIDKHL